MNNLIDEHRAWKIAVIVMAFLYVVTAPRGWQCEASDEIEYVSLAHSLATGAGYTINGQPYGLYPPLFPAVLALVWKVTGGSWWALYVMNAVVGFSGLVLLSNWMRNAHGWAGRWASWFALVAYYAWSFSTRYLLAEQLMLLFAALALVEFDRGLRLAKPGRRTWMLVPLYVLLAAMTKASAAAVIAAVGLAGGLAWLLRRNRAALALALLAMLLGGGFMVGWEVRSQLVTPDAPESYGRWVLKWVGLSRETTSVVAQNTGEGIAGDATFAQRAGVMAEKIGTYVASVVRAPDNYTPFALCLAALCALGLGRLLLENPASPLGWYMFFSILLGSLTFWASSYHRYLYPLTPLLYLTLLMGVGWLGRWPFLAVPFGLRGLAKTWLVGFAQVGSGAEAVYRNMISVVVVLLYVALVVTPFFIGRFKARHEVALVVFLLAVFLHNGALAADRFRRTRADETPRQQGLDHAMACAEWIRDHTLPETRVITSLPRMAAFLTHRPVVHPGESGDVVLLLGPLQGIPPFRPAAENALRQSVVQGGAVPAFASGGAAVYKFKP